MSLQRVSGSNEINGLRGVKSARSSLFCCHCWGVGGDEDEPDVKDFQFTRGDKVHTLSAMAISDPRSLNNESLWSFERL